MPSILQMFQTLVYLASYTILPWFWPTSPSVVSYFKYPSILPPFSDSNNAHPFHVCLETDRRKSVPLAGRRSAGGGSVMPDITYLPISTNHLSLHIFRLSITPSSPDSDPPLLLLCPISSIPLLSLRNQTAMLIHLFPPCVWQQIAESLCLSLIGDKRAVDLLCPTCSERDAIADGFSAMLSLSRRALPPASPLPSPRRK
jgi:hypothetical protein